MRVVTKSGSGARVLVAVLATAGAATPLPAIPAAERSAGELAQLVSPIALHPDALVSQILMASTYPLEIVQAARWVESHEKLSGDALAEALEEEPWDPSVKSLVAFPSILAMLDGKLEWTQDLGDAFLAQPEDVMAAVQELRRSAQAAGNLESSDEQVVTTEGQVIVIESAQTEVVYVPVYDPAVAYGVWAYPAYAPYYYYRPYGWAGGPYAAGVTAGAAWGYAWGRCDWNRADIDVDVDRNVALNPAIDRDLYRATYGAPGAGTPGTPGAGVGTAGAGVGTAGAPGVGAGTPGAPGTWQHDPTHRKGVGYADAATTQKYRRESGAAAENRSAYRGHAAPSSGATRSSAGSETKSSSKKSTAHRGSVYGDGSTGKQTRTYSDRGRSSAQKSSSSPSGGGARRDGRG